MNAAAVSALAAVAIAAALQISSGMYDARALALASLGVAGAVIAAIWRRRAAPFPAAGNPILAQAILGGGAAAGLACHLFVNPTFYGDMARLTGFRWFAMVGLVLLSAYLCLHLRASLVRARFLLLLACFAVMGVAILRASPRPWIDVWVLQQDAARALLHGANPYSSTHSNIYGDLAQRWYAPELVGGGRLNAYPYPPLAFLAAVPGYALFGDSRYAMLALLIVAAWLIGRAWRSSTGELAAALILFQPRTFFVLEQSWIEPVVLAAFALVVFALARNCKWWAAAGLGLLIASKQYSPYMAVPLLFAMPIGPGPLGLAAAVAAIILLPFALWDWTGFARGVVQMQLWQPFRPDALSLSSLAGRPGPLAWAGPVAGAAALAAFVRRGLDLGQACAAAAAALSLVVLSYKQSFCNYWWLCAALLCAAAAVPAGEKAA